MTSNDLPQGDKPFLFNFRNVVVVAFKTSPPQAKCHKKIYTKGENMPREGYSFYIGYSFYKALSFGIETPLTALHLSIFWFLKFHLYKKGLAFQSI